MGVGKDISWGYFQIWAERKKSLRVGLGSGIVRESLVEGKRILIEKKTIFVSIFVLDCCL